MSERTCPLCGEDKPLSDYYSNRVGCRPCESIRRAESYAKQKAEREVGAHGHVFNDDLRCACGATWYGHRESGEACSVEGAA